MKLHYCPDTDSLYIEFRGRRGERTLGGARSDGSGSRR